MRRPGSILAALFAAGVLASVGFVAPGATAARTAPVPKVVLIVGPAGSATNGYRAEARAAAAVARRYTPDVTEIYSPNATWPRGQGRAPGRVAGRLHGPRQRLAQPVPRLALPADPGRLRAQPVRRGRRRRASVLRGGADRRLRPSREGRGRAAPPPLLRERPVRARAAGRHAGGRPAAHRQLRQRLRRRGRVGGHRRGLREPVRLREGDPRRRPVHRFDLAHCAERQRPRVRLRECAQSRLPRADGPRDRELRLRALDRPEGRARARRRPRRRPRDAPACACRSTPARPACSAPG